MTGVTFHDVLNLPGWPLLGVSACLDSSPTWYSLESCESTRVKCGVFRLNMATTTPLAELRMSTDFWSVVQPITWPTQDEPAGVTRG